MTGDTQKSHAEMSPRLSQDACRVSSPAESAAAQPDPRLSQGACRVSSPGGASRPVKPSGIPWLGDVPKEWEIDKIKYHLKLSSKRNPGNAEILSLYREHGIVPKNSRDDNHNVTSLDTSNYKFVRIGDFAINKMKAWQGSMAVSGFEGVVSPAYYVYHFATGKLHRQYFHYLIRTSGYASEFRRLSTGVREGQWDLASADFENISILLPPLSEQRSIAAFLDGVGARIDGLREKMASEIERLEAYKRAFIAEAVAGRFTGGRVSSRAEYAGGPQLGGPQFIAAGNDADAASGNDADAINCVPPSRKTKSSGIPWLGDVPKEWAVAKGKYCMSLLSRPTEDDDGVITCFRDGEVTLRSKRREDGFTISLKELGYQGIEPGDLVVHGMDGFAGSIGVSDSRGKASPVLVVLDSEQDKRYLMYYLRSVAYKDVFVGLATGIRVRSCDLRWNKLAELPILLPPLPEQREIAVLIDRRIAAIDAVIAKRKAERERLDALKRSIICEAVTGKKEIQQ